MIKAVLFDLDGTLANTLCDLAAAANYALEKLGFPTHSVEAFKYFAGNGMPKMLERTLPENCRNKENVDKILPVFMEYYSVHYADKTEAYEGVLQLVNTLKSRGIKIAVVTNKAQESAEAVVNKLYGNVFDVIFGKRDNIPLKPDPTAAYAVMDMLGVNPSETVFLGDSGMDVATGVNCGAFPVGELWGFRDEKELKENGAGYIISKPLQLLDIIEEINNEQSV